MAGQHDGDEAAYLLDAPTALKARRFTLRLTIASIATAAALGLVAVALSHVGGRSGQPDLRGTVGLSTVFTKHGKNYTMRCGRTFDLKKVLHSNLGGKGPDHGKEGIVWLAEEAIDGVPVGKVHIEAHAESQYEPFRASGNGMHGDFGTINMPTGKEVKLAFEFKETDGTPRVVDEATFTFYDLDQAEKTTRMSPHAMLDLGKGNMGREFIRAYGDHEHHTTLGHKTQIHSVHNHGHNVYMSSQVGIASDNPADPEHLTLLQKHRSVAFTYKGVKDVTLELGSTDGRGYRGFEFALLNVMRCRAVVVPPPAEPFPWAMIAAAVAGVIALTGLVFFLYWACRPLTPEERKAKAKKEAEAMAKRAADLLSKDPVNYEDPELMAIVEKLKAHKDYVKALCGAPWKDWSAPGKCQVCNDPVDRKEKGLHCANGGHRICWKCMCGEMDWDKLCEDEAKKAQDEARRDGFYRS